MTGPVPPVPGSARPAAELVTVGESMARLSSPHVGRLRHAGGLRLGAAGAESNVAIGFQRLGGRATWIGRVGDDELGAMVAATIRGTGVDTVAVVDPDRPTGLMIKERRSSRHGRVVYYREDSAGSRLRREDVDEALLAEAGVVHLTGITAALGEGARDAVLATARSARGHGTLVSLDLNYRSALWSREEAGPVLRGLVEHADVLFCTVEEARLVVPGEEPAGLARDLAGLGPAQVVVKLGDEGSVAWVHGRALRVPAVPVPVVDSVGAGDAFAAGYLFELVRGAAPDQRLRTGTRTGAYAVMVDGDWEGAPTYAELADVDAGGDAVRR